MEEGKSCRITLLNPMSADLSLKHWRQIFNPYLRMRPALWVQTRLHYFEHTLHTFHKSPKPTITVDVGGGATHHPREPFPKLRGREYQTWSCAMIAREWDVVGFCWVNKSVTRPRRSYFLHRDEVRTSFLKLSSCCRRKLMKFGCRAVFLLASSRVQAAGFVG